MISCFRFDTTTKFPWLLLGIEQLPDSSYEFRGNALINRAASLYIRTVPKQEQEVHSLVNELLPNGIHLPFPFGQVEFCSPFKASQGLSYGNLYLVFLTQRWKSVPPRIRTRPVIGVRRHDWRDGQSCQNRRFGSEAHIRGQGYSALIGGQEQTFSVRYRI